MTNRRRGVVLAVAAVVAGVLWVVVRQRPTSPDPEATPPVSSAPALQPSGIAVQVQSVVWEPVADKLGERTAPLPQRMLGLVSGGSQLVAWGTDFPTGRRGESAAVLWISSDGRGWRRVTFTPAGLRAGQRVDVRRMAGGRAGFVAIGAVCCRPDEMQVWHSADGEAWVRGELADANGLPTVSDAELLAVASGTSGFVLTGTTPDGPAIWRSVDGIHWKQSGFVEGVGSGQIGDVRFTGETFLAAGRLDSSAELSATWDPALWVSEEGTTWRRLGQDDPILADGEDGEIQTIVPFAKGFWAFGISGTHAARVACPAREDCSWFDFAAWFSSDGVSWQRLPPPLSAAEAGPRLEEYRVVDAAWGRLIAVGEDSLGSPALWTSADGRSWERAITARGLPAGAAVNGIAVRGDEVVAIGTESNATTGDDGAVWIGHVLLAS